MKHTTGNWKLSSDNRITSGATHIARVDLGIADKAYVDLMEEEQANAKLIAAAPDLLEALKSLLATAETWADNVQYPSIQAAKAAIKKATE